VSSPFDQQLSSAKAEESFDRRPVRDDRQHVRHKMLHELIQTLELDSAGGDALT
jgi:hypothetical protein